MTIKELKNQDLLLFEAVSGSHAYGLQHKDSDVDLRGLFVLPKAQFYSLTHIEQVSDKQNDEVYYELKKFIDMLVKNKPNFLEVLGTPADCIRYQHPLFEKIKLEDFLSKQAKNTFAGYESVLAFCYVQHGQGSLPLLKFLKKNNFRHEDCGLVISKHHESWEELRC